MSHSEFEKLDNKQNSDKKLRAETDINGLSVAEIEEVKRQIIIKIEAFHIFKKHYAKKYQEDGLHTIEGRNSDKNYQLSCAYAELAQKYELKLEQVNQRLDELQSELEI